MRLADRFMSINELSFQIISIGRAELFSTVIPICFFPTTPVKIPPENFFVTDRLANW